MESDTADPADPAAAAALVRHWWDRVWGEGDLDAIDDLLTDPYTRHTSAGSETIGRDQYKAKLVQYQRVLHRPITTTDDEVVSGDKVWTRATSRGLNRETGDVVVLTWIAIHRIEGGRLAEAWVAALPGVDWRS